MNCLIVLNKLLELHNRVYHKKKSCTSHGNVVGLWTCLSDKKRNNLPFAAKSHKADSVTCMLYLSPAGFLIIRMLLNILLQLWISISLHNRRPPLFLHPGHRASLCSRPEQKSIIALDRSLKHTYSLWYGVWGAGVPQMFTIKAWVSVWLCPKGRDKNITDGWLNIIII